MFIEKGKVYYRVGTGDAVRVIAVLRHKGIVVAAVLKAPGGKTDIPYEEFQAAFTLDKIIEAPREVSKRVTDPKHKQQKYNYYSRETGE